MSDVAMNTGDSAKELLKVIEKEREQLIKEGKIKKTKPLSPINKDEIPFEIPESWEWVRLPEVLHFQEGPGILAVDFRSKGIPLIRISGLQTSIVKLDGCNYLDPLMVEKKWNHFKLDVGDIVISTSASLDKIAVVDNEAKGAIPYTGIIRFKMYNGFLPTYFKYFVQSNSYINQINNMKNGTAIQHYGPTHLQKMIIPLPPLSEQKEIVNALDELFAKIDKAKANIEKNIENVGELFQSKLNEIFSQTGKDWVNKKLVDVCVLQRGFDLPVQDRKSGEYPLVSSGGITDTISEYKIKAPGVVTGRSGSIGEVFFITKNFWPLNTSLFIKEFHGNNEKYIYYLLKHFDLSKHSNGAGVLTLNRNIVHDKIVNTTDSIVKQKEIVGKLDILKEQTDALKAKYNQKLLDLEELKKSALEKAFRGELIKS